jgi:hypothetical protein
MNQQHAIVLRPALESSVLSQFINLTSHPKNDPISPLSAFKASGGHLGANLNSDRVELNIKRTHVLQSSWLYNIAHSLWYRLGFFPITLFLMISVTVLHVEWMQNPYALGPIIVVCGLTGLCALTRMDRTLIRCLTRRFDWGYLCFVMLNFIMWNTWSQSHLYNIWYIFTYIIVVTPMSLVLLHLDSVPKYPPMVKISMLICGICLTCSVIFTDWLYYIRKIVLGHDEEVREMDDSASIVVPDLFQTTTRAMANQTATEVCMFLVKNLYLTITTMRSNAWKNMTTLRLPLVLGDTNSQIQSHFQLSVTTRLDGYQNVEKTQHFDQYYVSEPVTAHAQQQQQLNRRVSSVEVTIPISPTTEDNISSSIIITPQPVFNNNAYTLALKDPNCELLTDCDSPTTLLQLKIPFRAWHTSTLAWHNEEHWYTNKVKWYFLFIIGWLSIFHTLNIVFVHELFMLAITLIACGTWVFIELSAIDRKMHRYLFFSFEVIMFIYQMIRVFGSQVLMKSDWSLLSLGIIWITFNLQTIFLDASVFQNTKVKAGIVFYSILLSIMLLTGQRWQSGVIGAATDSYTTCYIDCANSQVRFFIALTRLTIFQSKYLIRSLFWPNHCSLLFIPLLYRLDLV